MDSPNEQELVENADSPICEDFEEEDFKEYFEEDFEDFEDHDNIQYWVDLDEDKNILFSFKDQCSVNIFETKLTSDDIGFFRRLLENLNTVDYKDSINSGTFIFHYGEQYFSLSVTLEHYYTNAGTSNVENIRKLVEDILKKYDEKTKSN